MRLPRIAGGWKQFRQTAAGEKQGRGDSEAARQVRSYAYTTTSTRRHGKSLRETLRNRRDKQCQKKAAKGMGRLTKAVIRPPEAASKGTTSSRNKERNVKAPAKL